MIETDGPGVVTLGEDDRALAVAAVKAVLRLASDGEDTLIAAFAETALGLAEQFLGMVLIARALRVPVAVRGAWHALGVAPVLAITGVETAAGVALPSDGFAIDIDAAGEGWVRIVGAPAVTSVVVLARAGLAEGWAGLPAPIRQGVVLLAAHLFEQRDASVAPPSAITALWRPFRRIALRPTAHAC